MKRILLITFALLTQACTHLTTLSVSPIPENRSKPIRAESSRFIFMYFNFDTDYVNDMTLRLAQQCPSGDVKGILTKHEQITYFPIFAHRSRVTASGYCVAERAKQ